MPDNLPKRISHQALAQKYITLIYDSFQYLEDNEHRWGLAEPINRVEFLRDVLVKANFNEYEKEQV